MKKVFFIVQAKGGSGKSFLTTLIAHKYSKDLSTFFYDMDSSTKSLSNQIKFLENFKERVDFSDILNSDGKIERDQFINFFESLDSSIASKIFVDFGATESDQLFHFLKNDLDPVDMQEFFTNANIELNFLIPVSGNTAIKPTTDYARSMDQLLGKTFSVNFYENSELTDTDSSLIIQEKFGKKKTIKFGNTDSKSERGKRIVNLMKEGQDVDSIGVLSRGMFKKLYETLDI